MTNFEATVRPSLAKTVSLRIAAVAAVTVAVQMAIVIGTNYFDYEDLYLHHITHETRSLLRGVKADPGGLSFVLPEDAGHYRDARRTAYAFRVLDASGRIIAAEQQGLLEPLSPWGSGLVTTADYWFRTIYAGKRLHFAGGKKFRVGDADVLIEVATLGDPAGTHWWVVAHETIEDVWLPILPFAVFVPLTIIVSVRHALNPLVRAAHQAERLRPGDAGQQLDLAGLPREAAALASAINGLMQRVSSAIHSQRVFIASAAHALRTPLSVMVLELGNIDHPRARRLESDVAGMSESVNRLLLFARLDAMQPPDLLDVDLGGLAKETIDHLRTWASAHGHTIDLRLSEPQILRGHPVAIREALRNLVENAVKHTPTETLIRVTVAAGGAITVEDSGPGLPTDAADELFQPFRKGNPATEGAGLGLAIVAQAVELHQGSILAGRSSLGGAMFQMRFA